MPDKSADEPLETRLARYLADAVYMPHHCPRRVCRRQNHCQGTVSATGEPCCVAALAEDKRSVFANFTQIARDQADILRIGGNLPVKGCPTTCFILRLGLWAAIRAYADLAINRRPLRQRLRLFKSPVPLPGTPPREAGNYYYRFGLRETDTGTQGGQPSPEASGR